MYKTNKVQLANVTGFTEYVSKVSTVTVKRLNVVNTSQCCASGTCD